MESLINYLLQFGQLNQQQIDLVKSKAIEIVLKKDDYFSEAGKVANQVGFVISGVLSISYFNNKGQEITRYFIDENNFVVDLYSFSTKIPSSEYIRAVTNCEIIFFSANDLEELSLTIIGWDKITSQITSKALMEKVNRISPMVAEDAKVRYNNFLEKFPGIANRIPLSLLASYLGITQSSLSRIRRNN
jgi:CRP-like cAMP-binding protein